METMKIPILELISFTCATTFSAPFETIKLQQQMKTSPNDTTIFGLMDSTFRKSGFGGFFAGNTYRIAKTLFRPCIKQAVQNAVRKWTRNWNPKQNSLSQAVVYDCLSLLFVHPLDVWRTLAGVAPEKCNQTRSLKDLYAGFALGLFGRVVHRGVFTCVYRLPRNKKTGKFLGYCTTTVAALVAGLVVYPIDTLCRRQMVQPELSVVDAFTQDTVASLWNGASVNIVRSLVGLGTLYVVDYLWLTRSKKKTKKKTKKKATKKQKKKILASKIDIEKLVGLLQQKPTKDDDDEDCPICMEALPKNYWDCNCGRMFCCGKRMHITCYNRIVSSKMSLEQKNRCVMCRSVLSIQRSKEEIQQIYHWVRKGKVWAYAEMGGIFSKMGSDEQLYKLAKKLLELASQQGDAVAQHNLGLMYLNGQGVPKSFEIARKYFEAAAEQGYATAQFNLAFMYQQGEALEKNDEKVKEYLEPAAEKGHADAQYYLGLMYYQGNIVEQSYETTREWWMKAAEQGHEKASTKLLILQKDLKNGTTCSTESPEFTKNLY